MEKHNILLVDDEADFSRLMAVRIRGWGYNYIQASTGKEGVDAVKNKKPDIVILDYMLPDMDGIAVLREMRKINDKIPVIMFTAYPSMKAMEEIDSLGISAFIPKLSIYSESSTALNSAINLAKNSIEGKDGRSKNK